MMTSILNIQRKIFLYYIIYLFILCMMADDKSQGKRRRNKRLDKKPQKEFEEVLLEVRRVTRVTTGGRQLSFRAMILIGNKKGKIALGVAK